MGRQKETSGPVEQHDRHQPSFSPIGRRRILAVSILIVGAMVLTVLFFYGSTYLGSTDWPLFWVGEMIVGIWLAHRIVLVLRKGP